MALVEQRKAGIRRDLNDLVRADDGRLSPAKIGLLIGQWLAIKLILENGAALIATWDSLMILFSVLIAPEMFKKLLNSKYGMATNGTVTTISKTDSTTEATTQATKVEKKK